MTFFLARRWNLAASGELSHGGAMKMLFTFALAGACIVAAPPARAEVHALLVGVGDYLYLDADLRGPVNDVGLMARTLLARGATSVQVLADPAAVVPDGIAPPVVPTRAAILAGLADLADKAGPGDQVIFYFSGLGATVPDLNGDKAEEYDEIFLPADVKNWRGAIGAVENAIAEDEFQPLFQAILDTGAMLVAIIDACHSATGFRALGPSVGAQRCIPNTIVGVPEVVVPVVSSGPPSPPLEGDFAFLYSSQSNQRSFEFPLGAKDDLSNWYGDFTRALAGVLRETADLTWAQALRGATESLQKEAAIAVQTPEGAGTALDVPVFGSGMPPARRVAFVAGVLQAGLLSGYDAGAVFDLYPDTTAAQPVARAVLRNPRADTARLEVESGTMPASGYGAQVQPGLPAPFRVSVPVIQDAAGNAPLLDALGALAAAGLPEGVAWNDDTPDAVVILTGGKLALTGPDGVLDPAGPGSTPRMGDEPAAFFERAARAHLLRRALALAESQKPTSFALPGAGLVQKIEHQPGSPNAVGCDEPVGGVGPFDPAQPLGPCDRLWVSLSNLSKTAQDVTVLYVDRMFNTSALWPEPGLSNRIYPGEMHEVGLEIRLPDRMPGQEELIVIAVPAAPGAARTVLTSLADLAATRAGADAPALQQYLETAADPAAAKRSFDFSGAVAPLSITRTRLDLVPDAH